MKRVPVLVLTGLISATACGGPDVESDSEVTAPADSEDEPVGAAPTTAPAGDQIEEPPGEDELDISGLGEATITLEGEIFHFGETDFSALRCDPDMFGVFWVFLGQVDESGNEVPDGGDLQLILLGDGTDESEVGQVPEARLELTDRDQVWVADPEDIDLLELAPGTSQIDDYSVEGKMVSGTATFYEVNSYYAAQGGTADETLAVEGSFEATCAG